MSFNYLFPRDAPTADSGSSTSTSEITRGCKPVSTWLKLCPHDFAAVVGILCFICYVIWGIPLTIRLLKYCKLSVTRLFKRVRGDASSVRSADLEGGNKIDDSEFEYAYMDPYYSSTGQLHEFLRHSTYVVVPAPTASPKDKHLSQPSPSSDMDDTLRAKTRLSRFRFPPAPSAFTFSMYSQTDTIVDARHVHGQGCGHGHKNTREELDDLVSSFSSRGSREPYSCSTPVVKSKRVSSGTDTSSFKMFDLDSYSYKSTEVDDDSLGLEDGYGNDLSGLALPTSPPPAYLDQHPAFGSSARFANVSL